MKKNQILSLILSSIIFTTNPLFAMDPPDPKERQSPQRRQRELEIDFPKAPASVLGGSLAEYLIRWPLSTLFNTVNTFLNFLADQPMDPYERRIQTIERDVEKKKEFEASGDFTLLPHEIFISIRDSLSLEAKAILDQTCKSYYNKCCAERGFTLTFPLREFMHTFPATFKEGDKHKGFYLEFKGQSSVLNLYHLNDKQLRRIGLTESRSPSPTEFEGFEGLRRGDSDPKIPIIQCTKKILEKVKVLRLKGRYGGQDDFSDLTLGYFKSKGITVQIVYPIFWNLNSLKNLEGLRPYHRCLWGDFSTSPNAISLKKDVLKLNDEINNEEFQRLLDAYAIIKKTGRVKCDHHWTSFEGLLIEFAKDPNKLSLFQQLCTGHLYSDQLFRDEGLLNTLNVLCFMPLQKFIPAYKNNHYKDGLITPDAEQEIVVFSQDKKEGITRGSLAYHFFSELSAFEENEQALLLERLLHLLRLDHITQINKKSRGGFGWDFRNNLPGALNTVKKVLFDLSEKEYNGFVSYLEENKIDINPLLENFEENLMLHLKNL